MHDIGLISREEAERDSRGNALMTHEGGKLEGSLGVELVQQLLPGIPDDIAIDLVAPKLPWIALCSLSRVSRGWQRAIRSRQVHDARVRSQSTQTLVVMTHNFGIHVNAPALYSSRENSFYHRPQFLTLDVNDGELPPGCRCISLDGKVYVMGGYLGKSHQSSAAVYVLDLAGQGKWKQCASMQDPRSSFGCGVINGKIYVFGGTAALAYLGCRCFRNCRCNLVWRSEVYDPKSDAWSPIAPMKYPGFGHNVVTMGEGLFVQDKDNKAKENRGSVEVYYPLKDQWRILDHFLDNDDEILLTVGGKLHKLTPLGIHVYAMSTNSWEVFQLFSFPNFGRANRTSRVDFLAAVVVDDELLAVVRWSRIHPIYGIAPGTWLMRSQGLGYQRKEIEWHKIQPPLLSKNKVQNLRLCAIQL